MSSCVPKALPREQGDGAWCILTPLQTGGWSLCGGTKQGARPKLLCLALGSLLPFPCPVGAPQSLGAPESLAELAQLQFPSPGEQS